MTMFLKTKRINGERRHVVMEAYRKGGRVHLRKIRDLGPVEGRWTRVKRLRLWEDALAQSDELKAAEARWDRDGPDFLTAEARLSNQYWADGIKTPSVEARWEEIQRGLVEAARRKFEEHNRRLITHGSASESGCLAVLGLTHPTTLDAIQSAFRRKAVAVHPDRGGSHEAMVGLNRAYQEARAMVGA